MAFTKPNFAIPKIVNPNPKLFFIFGLKKIGKSFACANLLSDKISETYTLEQRYNDVLLIDLEKSYEKYLHFAPFVAEVDTVKDFKLFTQWLIEEVKVNKAHYKYAVIDTITILEKMFTDMIIKEINSMLKQQGKLTKYSKSTIESLSEVGTAFEDLNGWLMLEDKLLNFVDFCSTFADHVIILGHHRQDSIENGASVLVDVKDVSITGKKKGKLLAKCDAVGYLHKGNVLDGDEDCVYVNFETNDSIAGTRCPHLSNKKVLLSQFVGPNAFDINVHWENFYLPESEWENAGKKQLGNTVVKSKLEDITLEIPIIDNSIKQSKVLNPVIENTIVTENKTEVAKEVEKPTKALHKQKFKEVPTIELPKEIEKKPKPKQKDSISSVEDFDLSNLFDQY